MTSSRLLAVMSACALSASLLGCSQESAVTQLDDARAQNQARHVAERFGERPIVLDDPAGFETSHMLFSSSEAVVVTDATLRAQLRGASIAVTAHTPLIVYSPQRHGDVVEEIKRLGAHTILTVGDVALAPVTGVVKVQRDPGGLEALHEMTSLRFDVRDITDPSEAVPAVAELAGDPPTWLRTPDAPATKPRAEVSPFPLQSRRDADMAPLVVATPQSPVPAVANARSFGARVKVVREPDPRHSEETLFVLAGLARSPLVALGPQFGQPQELSRRIMQAEEYY